MSLDPADLSAPFRMQPGLARLEPGHVQLTRLAPGGAAWAAKQAVAATGAHQLSVPGFDPGPALRTLAALHPSFDPASDPALHFEEDLAVLDGMSGTVPWMCVCLPSHWAPEDKIGLDFRAIHAPVADNAALIGPAAHLIRLVTDGGHWRRKVWTITPSARLDQHPRRHAREPWPLHLEPPALLRGSYLRVEEQQFIPVREAPTAQALFTIRITVEPLAEWLPGGMERARALHAALESMSPAVLAYKGLAAAREPLLAALRGPAALNAETGAPPAR